MSVGYSHATVDQFDSALRLAGAIGTSRDEVSSNSSHQAGLPCCASVAARDQGLRELKLGLSQ